MTKDEKLQNITVKFYTETVKFPQHIVEEVLNPATGKKKPVSRVKMVDTLVTVCDEAVFDELIQVEFGFKSKRAYRVKLDLWSSLPDTLDPRFLVVAKPKKSTGPMVDEFRRNSRRLGMVPYLLDYFRGKGLIPVGHFIIRFPDAAPLKPLL